MALNVTNHKALEVHYYSVHLYANLTGFIKARLKPGQVNQIVSQLRRIGNNNHSENTKITIICVTGAKICTDPVRPRCCHISSTITYQIIFQLYFSVSQSLSFMRTEIMSIIFTFFFLASSKVPGYIRCSLNNHEIK